MRCAPVPNRPWYSVSHPSGDSTDDPDAGFGANLPVSRTNREAWESRARELGSQLSSVLCRGLPAHLNVAMDSWHRRLLQQYFLADLPPYARVLDGGCGYGRLSRFIRQSRPDLTLVGCDLAHAYCVAFAKFVAAPSVCMALEKPAFAPDMFDGIVAVNALMYLDPAAQVTALRQLRALLVPGGKLFLLEPGLEYFSVLARIGFASATGGHGFSLADFQALATAADLRTLKTGSAPLFSVCLPVMGLAARLGFRAAWPANLAVRWDARIAHLSKWSAYRWQLLQRP